MIMSQFTSSLLVALMFYARIYLAVYASSLCERRTLLQEGENIR